MKNKDKINIALREFQKILPFHSSKYQDTIVSAEFDEEKNVVVIILESEIKTEVKAKIFLKLTKMAKILEKKKIFSSAKIYV